MGKTLSATTTAPAACASSATPAMSTTSSVGFDIDSRKTSLVPGRSAARHWSRSVPSTKVTSMPKRGSRVSQMKRQEPKRARAATTWSPASSREKSAPCTAAMPEAVAKASSAPSSPAMRSSNMRTVGLP